MISKKHVDVLIPVYNGSLCIVDAVNSAINQEGVIVKVYVVNNGSTDLTEQVIMNSFISEISEGVVTLINFDHVDIISNFNRLKEIGNSLYLQILCHDDLLIDKKSLSKKVDVFLSDSSIGLVGGFESFLGSNRKLRGKKSFGNLGFIDGAEMRGRFLKEGNFWGGPSNFFLRRSILEKYSFSPLFRCSYDRYFLYQISAEWNAFVIDSEVYRTRIHDQQDTSICKKSCLFYLDELLFLKMEGGEKSYYLRKMRLMLSLFRCMIL